MGKSKISIVIPCYNDYMHVNQAIESALNQTYSPKEIIVVDDGSNTATKKILENISDKIDVLITQENKGQSTARNVGIERASGDYILVLDSDDFFENTFCEESISILENSIDSKLITCFSWLRYEDGTKELYKPKGGYLKDFLFANQAMGSVMFRKNDWLKAGGYDEAMKSGFEDWEFYIRLFKDGGNATVLEKPLFNYRKRNNSTTKIANSKKHELWKYIFIKHKDLYCSHYEVFLEFFLQKLKREEEEKIKNTKRPEFRIGKAILQPLREIKKILISSKK